MRDLERLLEKAKMPNTRERLANEIQQIADKIAGHIKEIGQKWPGVEP